MRGLRPPFPQEWHLVLWAGYTLLWVLLFPFTCWGAVGDLDHPHASPHLVFAGDPAPQPVEKPPIDLAGQGLPAVAGQSTPTVLLALAVWLLLAMQGRPRRIHLPQSTGTMCHSLVDRTPHIPVITPPPETAWSRA